MNGGWEIPLRWMPLDLTDDKSTLVQVMAWCRQATSHYLSQCWPRSTSLNGVTRPQWVNHIPQGCFTGTVVLVQSARNAHLKCMSKIDNYWMETTRNKLYIMLLKYQCYLSMDVWPCIFNIADYRQNRINEQQLKIMCIYNINRVTYGMGANIFTITCYMV